MKGACSRSVAHLKPEAVEKEVAFIFERDDQLLKVKGFMDKNQLKCSLLSLLKFDRSNT